MIEKYLKRAQAEADEEMFDFILQHAKNENLRKVFDTWNVEDISCYTSKLMGAIENKSGLYEEIQLSFQKYHTSVKIGTNAPKEYQAILTGKVSVLKFYLEQGLKLPKDSTKECIMVTEFALHRETSYDDAQEKAPYYHEGGYSFTEIKNDCWRWVYSAAMHLSFHDPLTAAILSQSEEMIAYIDTLCGDMQWNECMERSIALSSEEITAYMIKQYPEILSYFRLSAIIEGKNALLLKEFLFYQKEHMTEKRREAKGGLKVQNTHFICDGYAHKIWKEYDEKESAEFYAYLLSVCKEEEIKELIIKRIFLEILTYIKDGNESELTIMPKLFRKQERKENEDYTEEIWLLCKSYEGYMYSDSNPGMIIEAIAVS